MGPAAKTFTPLEGRKNSQGESSAWRAKKLRGRFFALQGEETAREIFRPFGILWGHGTAARALVWLPRGLGVHAPFVRRGHRVVLGGGGGGHGGPQPDRGT